MKEKYLSERQHYDILEAQLREERLSFKNAYRDLSKYILPRRSRFFTSDVNRGDRRNLDIIDSTASLASRTLSSGMMTGITSPARSWFKLNTDNANLGKSENVKQYLSEVTDLMRGMFLRSNLYNVLPVLYGDVGTFGTGCIYMEEDMEDAVNFMCFPVGSYMIANDNKGRARVFFREFQMSVRQIVEKFGMSDLEEVGAIDWKNISQHVKDQYDQGQYESMVDIAHFISPNDEYHAKKLESRYKKFKSVYYEKGISATGSSGSSMPSIASPDKFLVKSGYDFFPVMAVRWELVGEDTYGTNSPGMVSIGDVKQLQLGEKRIAAAIDQKVKPSMVGPLSLKNQKASILPGDITYLDEREGNKGFRRLFEIDFDTRELEGKQDQIRQRISRAYYEDLFLMLANTNRRQITAREIDERHEEKLLALGPVLERINQDLLDPLIDNSFAIMERQGLLPPMPDELQGQDYKVEYVSIMAQAQKLAGIGNIERLVGFVGQVGQFVPEVVDKVDAMETIELYADLVGVPPNLIKSKEQMEAIAEQRAAAAQAEQKAMEAQQMVDAGKTLSETKMDEGTALNQLLGGPEGA